MSNKCDICDEKKARYNEFLKKYLCEQCADDPEYKLIYKTKAKKKYFLNDNDLLKLPSFETRAYNGYKYCDAYLYLESDIVDCFCKKNKIDINSLDVTLEMLKNRKKERSKKIKETKENNINIRRKKLIKALRKMGLEMRRDSKLCEGYIDGSIKDWTLEEVVNRMCQMKFLYEYANMKHYLIKAEYEQMKHFNDDGDDDYIPDIPTHDLAELYALEECGGYPDEWPWLKNE